MDIVLPEIVAIGVYNSRLAVKNKTVTKNRKTTMFEIELPLDAEGISFVNSESAAITPDVIICAKPGQTRHTKLPYKCFYIHLMLKEGALYDALISAPVYIKTFKSESYKEVFAKLCKYYDSEVESDKIIMHSLVLELIYLLSSDTKNQYYKEKIKNNNFEIIEKVIRYVKENLSSDLSLKTVAAYANLSPIHFHNCFKASTGKTLHEYVEEQRIKKASNLLVTTDWTLTQISDECGFSSQSYFSYAFKRKMKLTPREYAKEIYKRYDN